MQPGQRARRHVFRRRLLVMAGMYLALLFGYPSLARDLLSYRGAGVEPVPLLDLFDGGPVRLAAAESPDGRFVAATEYRDRGGLGRGPCHVSVAPMAQPGRKTILYYSDGWNWWLVPRWTGPRRLEVSVLTDREPTLDELASSARAVTIGGEQIEVSLDYQEPRGE